jgi:hypothetical protein
MLPNHGRYLALDRMPLLTRHLPSMLTVRHLTYALLANRSYAFSGNAKSLTVATAGIHIDRVPRFLRPAVLLESFLPRLAQSLRHR